MPRRSNTLRFQASQMPLPKLGVSSALPTSGVVDERDVVKEAVKARVVKKFEVGEDAITGIIVQRQGKNSFAVSVVVEMPTKGRMEHHYRAYTYGNTPRIVEDKSQ